MNERAMQNEDYKFQFKLGEMDSEKLYDDPIAEFIRAQLAEILNFIVLISEGEEVKPDGFKLTDEESEKEYMIFEK